MNPVSEALARSAANGDVHDDDMRLLTNFRGPILDVGANCGQSLVSIRAVNQQAQLTALEPNPIAFMIMQQVCADLPGVRFEMLGLSDRHGRAELYTPVIDRLLLTALASFDPVRFTMGQLGELLKTWQGSSRMALLRQCADFARGDDLQIRPEAIKIDIEGNELAALHGLVESLQQCRPLLIVEKSDPLALYRFLAPLGYLAFANETGRTSDFRIHEMALTPLTDVDSLPLP